MREKTREFLKTLTDWEKQEVILHLTEEVFYKQNRLLNSLKNVEEQVFGMLHNKEANKLNDLTVMQLERLKKYSNIEEVI